VESFARIDSVYNDAGMRIGIFLQPTTIDAYVAQCKAVAEEGFHTVWSPQIFGIETLVAIAVAGREVPGITFGTAVVPTYPRHPMTMAQMALAAADATKGRLILGIGLSHQVVIEGMYGMSFDKPAVHMKEYLAILGPLINDRKASVTGEGLTFRGAVDAPGAESCPILLAALAPAMLRLAGTHADGTITWMTGPRTIEEHIIPLMHEAASKAGRATPSTMAGLPICVTSDVEGARARASKEFAIYGQLPSYRAVLDREGAAGPADIAAIGDERTVAAAIKRVADTGTTELIANVFGSAEEQARTRELLGSLL
jgi:F420-dependent oxidoreductase-like protein